MATHPRIVSRRVARATALLGVAAAIAALLFVAHMEYQDARAREVGAVAYID